MPLYEYRCEACGNISEHLQKMADPPPPSCEACGNGPLTKLMSQTSFILKGSGWYVTDFRDNKKGKPPAGGDKPKTDGDTSGPAAASAPPDSGEAKSASNTSSSSTDSDSSAKAPATPTTPAK